MSGNSRESNDAAQRVSDLADDLAPYHKRYEAMHDSRAVFAYAYFNLTLDLADWLAGDDEFDDPPWVADLAVAFGSRYRSAMDALDEWQRNDTPDVAVDDSLDETVPRPWADVYWAICRDRSTVLEDLVFAMGAHITFDLPHALLDVGTETDHLADYHRMNEVLASRTDTIQDAVTDRYNRTIARLDRMAGGADEVFTNYWLRIGRSMAWYNAMRLQSSRSRSQAERSIERSAFHLIESVRSTGPWLVQSGLRLYRYLLPLTRRWPSAPPHPADRPADQKARW